MSFPFYKQPDAMDCGPTCLRMIAKHYKKDIPLQFLREKSQVNKEGVNLLGLSEAAELIGFRTTSARISFDMLKRKEIGLPTILHWNQNHYVVLFKVSRKGFHIADPGKGITVYSPAEFKEHWISLRENGQEKGIALLLEPGLNFQSVSTDYEEQAEKVGFKNLFNYVLPYKKLVIQLFIGIGIASILQLIIPFLTQSIVDVGVNTSNIHFVTIILIAQLALFAGRLTVEIVRGWILLHISTRINISILTDFLIKLMKLPVSFFDTRLTGDILQRMNDHNRIESFLTGSSISSIFSLVNLFVFSIVLAIFNVQIFFVFLLSSVLYSLWVVLFLKQRKSLDNKRFSVASKEQSATIQLIQGMQEIKVNGIERNMRWKWESLKAKIFKLGIKSLAINQWQQTGAGFINETKNIVITFLSATAVINGQMTLGSMLAVQYIIGQLNSPIEQLIGFIQSWQNARISIDRLNEIHALEDEEPVSRHFHTELPYEFAKSLSGGKSAPESLQEHSVQYGSTVRPLSAEEDQPFSLTDSATHENAIFLKNVSFSYPGVGNEPVLKNLNLEIPLGKTTAIVGTSGSGKTTLLKLLLKFYQPQKGDILLNTTSLSSMSHKAWRSHCGVVMQESYIFSETIARNIAIGAEKIDMPRLEQAAKIANITDLIKSLPLGYNTKIGNEGNGISMGQKQRILIARSVYRNPDFIFFDEATNSLDASNEAAIVHNLEQFLWGRTTIIVAHRLSTVKNADQIVVLEKGEIIERGTHQELVNLKGQYYTLVKNQLELGS